MKFPLNDYHKHVKFPLNSSMNREGRDESRVIAHAESRVESREVTVQTDYTRFYT